MAHLVKRRRYTGESQNNEAMDIGCVASSRRIGGGVVHLGRPLAALLKTAQLKVPHGEVKQALIDGTLPAAISIASAQKRTHS